MFTAAKSALDDVHRSNAELEKQLNVEKFFFNIRPYFKTYKVGRKDYRGANAGDFAAINEVDLLLGLCRVTDPSYSGMLIDKLPFITLEDQRVLQNASGQRSFMDEFLALLDENDSLPDVALEPLRAFIETCERHGDTSSQHHERFVRRYIELPAANIEEKRLKQITASGPPLAVVVAALNDLRDKRRAAERSDIDTRFADLARLRRAAHLA